MENSLALNLLVVLTVVCYTVIAVLGVKDLQRYFKEIKYYQYTTFEPESPVVGFIFLIMTCIGLGGLLVNF